MGVSWIGVCCKVGGRRECSRWWGCHFGLLFVDAEASRAGARDDNEPPEPITWRLSSCREVGRLRNDHGKGVLLSVNKIHAPTQKEHSWW